MLPREDSDKSVTSKVHTGTHAYIYASTHKHTHTPHNIREKKGTVFLLSEKRRTKSH